MEKMSNKFENGYSDYSKRIAINEDINDNIDYSNQEKDEVLDNPDVEGPTLGSYTDGYNDIIEDEEYDLDRYQEDSEYRKGVDDAMEELDEYY